MVSSLVILHGAGVDIFLVISDTADILRSRSVLGGKAAAYRVSLWTTRRCTWTRTLQHPFAHSMGIFSADYSNVSLISFARASWNKIYLWNPSVWLLFHGISVVWPVHNGSWRSARMSNFIFFASTSSPWWSWSSSINFLSWWGLTARGQAMRVHLSSGSRLLSPKWPRYFIGVLSGFSFDGINHKGGRCTLECERLRSSSISAAIVKKRMTHQ